MRKYLLLIFILFLGCSKNNSIQGYIEGQYTYVAPVISGKLEKLAVSRGDPIQKNSLLFILDQQPEQDQLKEAQFKLTQAEETLSDLKKGQRQTIIDEFVAQRSQATAAFNLDQVTLARYQNLYAKGAIDKASVDTASTNYQRDKKLIEQIDAQIAEAKLGSRINQIMAQEAVVKAAYAGVAQAKWALTQKTVYAPLAGQVYDTYYREGEFVAAGQPILSFLAPENIKLIFFVPETMLSTIKIGQSVQFGCDNCKTKYPAIISFISSKAEYTPPVIYSRISRDKLVFRVEAKLSSTIATSVNSGQPVDVFLKL